MSKYYIGGVATVSAFNKDGHLFTAKTLTDSSINISVSNEEIRGGEGAQLLGKFFHTTVFNLSLTDALFDFEYIMKQTGSQANDVTNAVSYKNAKKEQISVAGTTVTLTLESGETLAQVNFDGLYDANTTAGGNICWSESNNYPLTGSGPYTFDAGADADKIKNGELCITYPYSVTGTKQINVNAMYYPAEFSLIMRAKLFSGDACHVSDGQAAGEVIIEIPRFQLDGTIDLAMAMTSPATYSLNGSALANGCGCGEEPWYAKITQVIKDADKFGGYTGIVVDGDYLTVGEKLGVYAFAIGKTPRPLTLSEYVVAGNGSIDGNGVINAAGDVTITANVAGSVINGAKETAVFLAQ